MAIYRVGSIITRAHGRLMSFPRSLYRDGDEITIVDSREGSAIFGNIASLYLMDEEEAGETYPEAFERQD